MDSRVSPPDLSSREDGFEDSSGVTRLVLVSVPYSLNEVGQGRIVEAVDVGVAAAAAAVVGNHNHVEYLRM
jgi:hypothetical protein